MRIIDAHTHVLPQYAGLAVEVMDLCGIEAIVTLEWHDGFGDSLKRHLEVFGRWPGRFIVFGNVDWSKVNEDNFGERAAAQMRRDVAAGMRGLKIYKALGLDYRDKKRQLWRINDPAFDPIWNTAGELGIPILMHTADPAEFWMPVDERNFWNGVLYGEYAWWSYYGKDLPGKEQLLSDRNAVIARHPRTTFICPHVGSRCDDLGLAGQDLESYPNLHYDISARLPDLARTRELAARAREFLLRYQDRIIFGTDIIYDDANVAAGMQAQCLCQPGEIPLAGVDPRVRYVTTTAEFFNSHIEFMRTDHIQAKPPFKRSRQGFTITGVNLPDPVCDKILGRNMFRLLGH